MSRKRKIIVSIVGITIVLLSLLGITYGYYLTRIQGNTNKNSISITTADLKLEYRDGNGEITASGVMPGDSISKTFSIENTGENKVTGYVIVLENVVNELSRREDLKYSLYCTFDDGTSCGKSENNLYPKTKNIAIIYSNDIDKDIKHNYELVINYIYLDDVNQSEDMGKTFSGKVNIYDAKDDKLNPFKTGVTATDNKSLAYNIIENARLEKNSTVLSGTPISEVAKSINGIVYDSSITNGTTDITMTVSSTYTENYYWTYASGYRIDDKKGIILTGIDSDLYSNIYDKEKFKYVIYRYASYNVSKEDIILPNNGVDTIYEIVNIEEGKITLKSITANTITVDEKVLSSSIDDYGTSYYFRGNVDNNYVDFADMCWRIVRIAGDGSTKLVLEDQDNTCNNSNGNWNIPTTTGGTTKNGRYGYTDYAKGKLVGSDGITTNTETISLMDYLHPKNYTSTSMSYAFKNFQKTFTTNELSKMKSGGWCFSNKGYYTPYDGTNMEYRLLTPLEIIDIQILPTPDEFGWGDTSDYVFYDSYVRLTKGNVKGYSPSFKCYGEVMDDFDDSTTSPTLMYVGALTADEIVFAGGKTSTTNTNYYILNNYQTNNNLYFWTLSPSRFYNTTDSIYAVNNNGKLFDAYATAASESGPEGKFYYSFRPVINLKNGTNISAGDGTKSNPYVIE